MDISNILKNLVSKLKTLFIQYPKEEQTGQFLTLNENSQPIWKPVLKTGATSTRTEWALQANDKNQAYITPHSGTVVYVGTTKPESATEGDTYISNGQTFIYNGNDWINTYGVAHEATRSELSVKSDTNANLYAKPTDGSVVYYGTNKPEDITKGNVYMSDGQIYVSNGESWDTPYGLEHTSDRTSLAVTTDTSGNLQAAQPEGGVVYNGNEEPTNPTKGDAYIKDHVLRIHDGSKWDSVGVTSQILTQNSNDQYTIDWADGYKICYLSVAESKSTDSIRFTLQNVPETGILRILLYTDKDREVQIVTENMSVNPVSYKSNSNTVSSTANRYLLLDILTINSAVYINN